MLYMYTPADPRNTVLLLGMHDSGIPPVQKWTFARFIFPRCATQSAIFNFPLSLVIRVGVSGTSHRILFAAKAIRHAGPSPWPSPLITGERGKNKTDPSIVSRHRFFH